MFTYVPYLLDIEHHSHAFVQAHLGNLEPAQEAWLIPDAYVRTRTRWTADDLQHVFEQCNQSVGMPRSLSVGDIVLRFNLLGKNLTYWMVAPVGFVQFEPAYPF